MRQTVICARESCSVCCCSIVSTRQSKHPDSRVHAHATTPHAALRPLCLHVQTKILLCRHNAERVGVTHAASPALHADDGIALAEDTELDGIHDAPLETAVDILLPWLRVEVWLCLVEVERVDAAVQVRVLPELVCKGQATCFTITYSGGCCVTGDHDDRAYGAVLGDETGSGTTNACQSRPPKRASGS